jgi:hypothetical protein
MPVAQPLVSLMKLEANAPTSIQIPNLATFLAKYEGHASTPGEWQALQRPVNHV